MAVRDFTDLKILLLDADEGLRLVVKQLLFTLNITHVREGEDGQEGLDILETYMPDVVISGFAMSPKNGIDFISDLRASRTPSPPSLPVVFIDHRADESFLKQARVIPATSIIATPLSCRTLFTALGSQIPFPPDVAQDLQEIDMENINL